MTSLGHSVGWLGDSLVGDVYEPPRWTRTAIVSEAREWLGTPYGHQRSIKGVRADCIGLVGGVPRELRMPSGLAWARDPEMRRYSPTPHRDQLQAGIGKYLVPIAIEAARPGDIYLMKWKDDPGHFAILTELSPPMIIHAYSAARGRGLTVTGQVAENNIAGFFSQGITWRSRILSAWAYQEATD